MYLWTFRYTFRHISLHFAKNRARGRHVEVYHSRIWFASPLSPASSHPQVLSPTVRLRGEQSSWGCHELSPQSGPEGVP